MAVGSDSMVARSQALGLQCGTSLPVQNRILRQLFWWRRWSRVQLAIFYVPSDKNPADPPSRRPRFVDREACMRAAEDRYVVWKKLQTVSLFWVSGSCSLACRQVRGGGGAGRRVQRGGGGLVTSQLLNLNTAAVR